MPSAPQPAAARAAAAAWVLALAYVAIALYTAVAAAPKVPYADSWRFLATFLTLPFPADALAADNGHREVLPNLVRIAELEWFAADQWLQILGGLGGAAVVGWLVARALRGAEPAPRAAGALVAAVGIAWLGNGRKVAHGSESLHLFLVLACLLGGLRALAALPREAGPWRPLGAALLGLVATLGFGSGIATFAAFGAVLLAQRAPVRHWVPLLGGGAVAAALLLFGGGGVAAAAPPLAPLVQADLLLRWLGAPFVWVLSPLLDPAHAARLPGSWLRELAAAVAEPVHGACGPPLAARWPSLGFGAAGLALLLLRSVALWRRRDAGAGERLALGVAWFGVAVGVLVVAARTEYFGRLPYQITTPRYVPWSMCLWWGLGLGFVLRAGRRAAAALALAFAMALLFLPSQVWTGRAAWRQHWVAEQTAVGAAVGVLGQDFDLVETMPDDLQRAVPLLRDQRAAMFAWPEAQRLGTRPVATELAPVVVTDAAVRAVANRFLGSGMAVQFTAVARAERLLLLDPSGEVRGLAVREPFTNRWQGWLRGDLPAADLRVAALR